VGDQKLPKPTESELEILQVIWRRGPSTVREIHQELSEDGSTGYTTVLKFLQIMTDKGLVSRDENQRAHIYSTAVSQQTTQRQLIRDLLDRAFNGSASQLVMQALSSRRSSHEELGEIRTMLASIEGDK
jgi:predicted transcriptional regulator